MRTRLVVILGLVVVVALGAIIGLAARGGSGARAGSPAAEPAPSAATTAAPVFEPAHAALQFDDDPPGTLRLEGQVINGADAPVGNATVVIDANPPREVRTEADGSFVFDQLTPRTYRVIARAGDAVSRSASVRLGQRTEPVILRLAAASRVAVTVTDDAGAPVRGALVELRDLVTLTAITDDAGRAMLRGVGAGWHTVKASADGHASAFRGIASVGIGDAELPLAIVLRAGASAAGVVVDASGAPIEGARVLPEHVGRSGELYDNAFDAVLTDAKGRWRLTGLPRETMRVRAHHAAYAPGASSPLVLGEVAERTGVTVVLDRGARVRGRVVDGAGAPVAGAEVRIAADTTQSGQVRRVAADADGKFALAGLPRRLMYAVAASDGASSRTVAIDLGGAEPAPLSLVLEHTAELSGIVVTGAGAPMPEARVLADRARAANELEDVEDRLRGSAMVIAGTDGRFRITGLEPGRYLVRAIRPGSSGYQFRARLGAPIETGTEARIVVDDLSSITGRVVLADGAPLTRFAIQLGAAPPDWVTSTDGAFRIADVPAGKQLVRISGPDVVPLAMSDVTVEATRPTDLGTIAMRAGRAVAGSVADASGRPVAGATVVIARELHADGSSLVPYPEADTVQLVTGADGRFRTKGIGTGRFHVAADHETAGRSVTTAIAPGTADAELALVVQRPGVLQGFVRIDGKPAEAQLALWMSGTADARIFVHTGVDGSYRFDRLAPGRYFALTSQNRGRRDGSAEGKSSSVVVPAGGVVTHDVDLSMTGATVVIHLASPGNTVQYAYTFIAAVSDDDARRVPLPTTIAEARETAAKSAGFEMREGMIVDRRQTTFDKVPPGTLATCAAPLRGDPKDPAVKAEMQQRGGDQPLYCKWQTLAAAPTVQHLTIEVQPLGPPPK